MSKTLVQDNMDDLLGDLYTSEVRDNCGIAVAHSLHDIHSIIDSLQHRGREAAGIAAIAGNRIDVLKWAGPVKNFGVEDLYRLFPLSGDYHTYMGHVRYSTKGNKGDVLADAHPHVIGGTVHDNGSHVMITNCDLAIVHNGQVSVENLGDKYKNNITMTCDTKALLSFYKKHGERDIITEIHGSYVAAIADIENKDVIVLRDRHGIKPGVLCQKDGKFGVASEDIAFRKNGGRRIQDLGLASIYYLAADGSYKKVKNIAEPIPKYCFFEWNYLSDAESVVNGVCSQVIREYLGYELAEEFNPPDVDLVTFLPRCPEPAAIAYADKTGKEFRYVFYKQKYERAFQGPTEDERKNSIEKNLYLKPRIGGNDNYLSGKTVLVIDDSIVRGNNVIRELQLLHDAGVKKVYHVSYTPPIGIIGKDNIERGCLFGVDMPPNDNFIARNRTTDYISKTLKEQVGIDVEVYYLSMKGMLNAYTRVGLSKSQLCTYCIGGKHPFN